MAYIPPVDFHHWGGMRRKPAPEGSSRCDRCRSVLEKIRNYSARGPVKESFVHSAVDSYCIMNAGPSSGSLPLSMRPNLVPDFTVKLWPAGISDRCCYFSCNAYPAGKHWGKVAGHVIQVSHRRCEGIEGFHRKINPKAHDTSIIYPRSPFELRLLTLI